MDAERETCCEESEGNKFSSAFWRLVEHNTDVSGFVAYGLYKYHKISTIKKAKIISRHDEALDRFCPDPYLAECFKKLADDILQEANSSVSTTAAVSAQSKQLEDIYHHVRKKNFWGNVRASATASILIAVLPLAIWLLSPSLRQPVGLWMIDWVASLSIDSPTQAINLFVEQLSDHERRAYVEAVVRQSVQEAVNPTFVLGAVVDNLDHRPVKDDVILQHLREALKRAESPLDIAKTIYWETEPAAPPPPPSSDDRSLEESGEAVPGFGIPTPQLRP